MNTFDIDTTQLIELENSLSPETSYMSPSLIFNLLDIVKKNHKFFDTIRIATTGDVYAKKDNTIQQVFALHGNINTNTNIHESKHLGIVLYKKEQATNWENDLLLDAKEIVKHITRTHHIDTIQLEPTSNICFHPKQQAIVSVPSSEVA
jgi:phenylalanyl-tRNA synthetase beta subunit